MQGQGVPSTLQVVENLYPKLVLGNTWRKTARAGIDYNSMTIKSFYRYKVIILCTTVFVLRQPLAYQLTQRLCCQYTCKGTKAV